MSLFRTHVLVTQNDPQTLLWAVLWFLDIYISVESFQWEQISGDDISKTHNSHNSDKGGKYVVLFLSDLSCPFSTHQYKNMVYPESFVTSSNIPENISSHIVLIVWAGSCFLFAGQSSYMYSSCGKHSWGLESDPGFLGDPDRSQGFKRFNKIQEIMQIHLQFKNKLYCPKVHQCAKTINFPEN